SSHLTLTFFFFSILRRPPTSPLFPYTTLFRSVADGPAAIQPILVHVHAVQIVGVAVERDAVGRVERPPAKTQRLTFDPTNGVTRSEEHTSELQSLTNLVCRLLLEKKNHKLTTQ